MLGRVLSYRYFQTSIRLSNCRYLHGLTWIFTIIITMIGLIIFNDALEKINDRRLKKFNDSYSPSLLKTLILNQIHVGEASSTISPANYLDPFVYSRIDFTHNDQRRSESSRNWCQTQSKAIRTQDLELSKCTTMKYFDGNEHVLCLDYITVNSCLVMSVRMGNSDVNDTFLNQLYESMGCRIFVFDPYQAKFSSNSSEIMMTIKPNWVSYRLGLTASAAVDDHSNLMTIGKLTDFIRLDVISARIDILQIDIDNANEWNLLDDNEFFLYLCRHVKQLIVKTKPIYSKRFQHYRIYTLKLNRCFSLLKRRSRLYLLGKHNQLESEWSLTTFSINLGLFCDEIDMSMYLLVYGHLYLVNTKL